jgi:multidrug efflux pump subunit AcrA (membrane-fusion protein)
MMHRRLWVVPLLVVVLVGPGRVAAMAGDGVVASGQVVPAQKAHLSFATAGRVEAVTVAEGDSVEAGEVLVTLETTLLEARVAEAEAAVTVAQRQLPVLRMGPRPGEIAAAEAQLEAAKAAVAQAVARRDQLVSGATEAQIAAAKAQLAAAQADEKAALIAYDQMPEKDLEDWEEEEIVLRLRAAEQSRNAAEAQVTLACESGLFQVQAAEAAIRTAEAQRDVVLAQLELIKAETKTEGIAAAEARVAQAEAALAATRAVLGQTTLRAPIDGEVITLDASPGETVLAGQVVVTLAAVEHLRVETTDLSERDVAKVAIGQQVIVRVEALGVDVGGRVVEIAPQATTIGGDVVYPVVVELDEQPSGLRWGMSVEVEIAVE